MLALPRDLRPTIYTCMYVYLGVKTLQTQDISSLDKEMDKDTSAPGNTGPSHGNGGWLCSRNYIN